MARVGNYMEFRLKGKKHSPVSESFLTHLKMEKANIVHEKFSWYEKY